MVRYPVLVGELAKREIKKQRVADAIGITLKTFNKKLQGQTCFTLPEVFAIRNTFFKEMSVDGFLLFMMNRRALEKGGRI